MEGYLESKVAEYKILLDWIDLEIQQLQKKGEYHHYLIENLKNEIQKAQLLYTQLKTIASINVPQLFIRAVPIIHNLELRTRLATHYYIPSLQRENDNDLFMRKLVLLSAKRLNLPWIKDPIVCFDGPHAIVTSLIETPVIYVPTELNVSLLDMAGLYHELGHNVFFRFSNIENDLLMTVSRYFDELIQSVGPMAPEKMRERRKTYEYARKYWLTERVNEIFSDIFATYVAGPAYYFFWINMALSIGANPYKINPIDLHPPLAARVEACYEALSPTHKHNNVIKLINKNWNAYTQNHKKEADYDFKCSSELLKRIVNKAIENIKRDLGLLKPYDKPLPDEKYLKQIPSNMYLEEILNCATKMFLFSAKNYDDWQKATMKHLRSSV